MFNCLLELVPLIALFIWEETSTLEIIYSLISLCGTPLIYHIGMESNRKKDIAHAKNSFQIVNKNNKSLESPDGVELAQLTKRRIIDDVRIIDLH